ncbi:hypothetical protein [Neobacillus drentensis]|uniref:hypothetical protein n=1 Tax=Neobacillus drentensis TaxID=220684 RepID=UPI003002B160
MKKPINTKLEHYLIAKEKIENGEWTLVHGNTRDYYYKVFSAPREKYVTYVDKVWSDGKTRKSTEYIHKNIVGINNGDIEIITNDGRQLMSSHSQIRKGHPRTTINGESVYLKKLLDVLGYGYHGNGSGCDLFIDTSAPVFKYVAPPRGKYSGTFVKID